MKGKNPLIKGVYAIMDDSLIKPAAAYKACAEALSCGIHVAQLRSKTLGAAETLDAARSMRAATEAAGAVFIVNDRIDIALISGADGVHLGHRDIPPAEARKILGDKKIIGFSTHTEKEAEAAKELLCKGLIDYISFGPVFPTKTKKDAHPVAGIEELKKARAAFPGTIVAIGGITAKNAREVMNAGADAIAVISAIFGKEDIKAAAEELIAATKPA